MKMNDRGAVREMMIDLWTNICLHSLLSREASEEIKIIGSGTWLRQRSYSLADRSQCHTSAYHNADDPGRMH